MTPTRLQKKRKFELNRGVVKRIIRQEVANNKQIIHGARAVNAQLPRFLKRATEDFDIFVKNPQRAAKRLETKLDNRFRGDFFRVKRGKSKRVLVRKVIANVTNKTVADFATPKRDVDTIAIRGKLFASLSDQKRQAIKNLTDPGAKFRRSKDRDVLRRIKEFEKLRGRKING